MRWVASIVLTLALGCGSETPPPAPIEHATAQGGETESAADAEGKWHHFWIIHRARDAVMRADVETTRQLLGRIADGDVGEDVPPDWSVWIEEMQDEAMRTERVRSLPDLAGIVSAIASRCGDCHRSIAGPPRTISLQRLEELAHGYSGTQPADANHEWAADELWLGMTVPLHQAWVRGSDALIESPLHAPPSEVGEDASAVGPQRPRAELGAVESRGEPSMFAGAAPGSAKREGLETLAHVGERLHDTGRPLMMARAYADLIRRCASCHQQTSAR